jgi:hypothetical protein
MRVRYKGNRQYLKLASQLLVPKTQKNPKNKIQLSCPKTPKNSHTQKTKNRRYSKTKPVNIQKIQFVVTNKKIKPKKANINVPLTVEQMLH